MEKYVGEGVLFKKTVLEALRRRLLEIYDYLMSLANLRVIIDYW